MSSCKKCGEEISWGWGDEKLKWVPVRPETLTGDEEEYEETSFHFLPGIHIRHSFNRFLANEANVDVSAAVKNAFARLFLLPSAPTEVRQAAYRALALQAHPDRGGTAEQMQALNADHMLISKRSA